MRDSVCVWGGWQLMKCCISGEQQQPGQLSWDGRVAGGGGTVFVGVG